LHIINYERSFCLKIIKCQGKNGGNCLHAGCITVFSFQFEVILPNIKRRTGMTPKADNFTTTNWSVVLAAGQTDYGRNAAALERLCRKKFPPTLKCVREKMKLASASF
jgi:hypothetical protein